MPTESNLYIQCRSLEYWRVEQRALQLKLRGRALQLFPLVRLARVIFIGPLRGEAGDLQRLLQHRIGIAFLDCNGRLQGAFYAPGATHQQLSEVAERLAWDRALGQWFAEWKENQTRHLISLIRGCQVARPQVPKSQREECHQWLWGLARVQFYQLAAEYQLDRTLPCHLRLMEQLTELLTPWLEMHLWRLLDRAPAADGRYCVRYFQRIEEELELQQRRLLVQLETGASRWL